MVACSLRVVVAVGILSVLDPKDVGASGVWVGWDWTPFPDLKYRADQVDSEDRKYRYESFGWAIQTGISPTPADKVTLGFGYSRRRLLRQTLSDRPDRLPTWNLYNLSGAGQWTHRWDDRTEMVLSLAPRYENGSESTSKSSDYKIGASALLRRTRADLSVGLGVSWGWDFGKKRLLPLLELEHTPSEGPLSVDILLPIRAKVEYEIYKMVSLSIQAGQSGGEYRVEGLDQDDDEWVRYRSASIGPGIRISLPGYLKVLARGGREFQRRVYFSNYRGQELHDEPAGSWIGQISLEYGELVDLRSLIQTPAR